MKNDGKYLQEALKVALEIVQPSTNGRLQWRRLIDAADVKSIRVPKQPADFFTCHPERGPFHIECKSSASKARRLSMFSQWADMRKWAKAGVSGLVLCHFHKMDNEAIYVASVIKMSSGSSWHIPDIGVRYDSIEKFIRDRLIL